MYGQRYALSDGNQSTNGGAGHHKSYKVKNMKNNHNNNANSNNLNNILMSEIDNEPILALFAIAIPFGPPSLFEIPQRETLFRTKHKVNLAPISIDPR